MATILCIATEWFSKKGGLSTFNRKLCFYLAKHHKVFCYLPDYDEKEKSDALKANVTLIEPPKSTGMPRLFCLIIPPKLPSKEKIDILIGHDRITGPMMNILRREFFPDTKAILFVHMNPAKIEWFKTEKVDVDPAAVGENRENLQKELAKDCSLIAAVGPKLFTAANTYMAGMDHPPIIRFDPGLYGPVEGIDYSFSWAAPEALIMGRLEDFYLKGVDIAFLAMTKISREWPEEKSDQFGKPNLMLRGCEAGKANDFRKKLEGLTAMPRVEIEILNYSPDAEILTQNIRRAAVTLMPSRTEGFGLVALEAISSGRPILVGRDTGFAVLLREIAPGESDHWIAPTDGEDDSVGTWAEKLQTIFLDRKAAADRLKDLVQKYAAKFSWEASVLGLMKSVGVESTNVKFDLRTALSTDVNFYSLPLWDNNLRQHVGEAAKAEFKVENGEIKVARRNTFGRNLLDIIKYRSADGPINFVAHPAPPMTDRAIVINFEARVIGDPVNLFFILHKVGNHDWYRHGWVQIKEGAWHQCMMVMRVEAHNDLVIQIQEKDFIGTNASYEIRKYVVEEWIGAPAAAAKSLVLLDGMHVERLIGFRPKDFAENIDISENSDFFVRINLQKPDQKFIIYLTVLTTEGQSIWLGFSGGLGTIPGKAHKEYTDHRRFPSKEVAFETNVFQAFRTGFPEIAGRPLKVTNVRLRASDIDVTEITFCYKIEER